MTLLIFHVHTICQPCIHVTETLKSYSYYTCMCTTVSCIVCMYSIDACLIRCESTTWSCIHINMPTSYANINSLSYNVWLLQFQFNQLSATLSTRSEVVNLRDLHPGLTYDDACQAIADRFYDVHNVTDNRQVRRLIYSFSWVNSHGFHFWGRGEEEKEHSFLFKHLSQHMHLMKDIVLWN